MAMESILAVRAETRQTFTAFFLDGTVDGQAVHIETRYRDILSFHLLLKQNLPKSSLPPFPSKKLFGNMEDPFVEARRQQLADYFAALLANPMIVAHPTFKSWISTSEHIANLAPSYEDLEQLRQQHQLNMAAVQAPPRPPSNERPFTAAPTPPTAKRTIPGSPRESPERNQRLPSPTRLSVEQTTATSTITTIASPASSSPSSSSSSSSFSLTPNSTARDVLEDDDDDYSDADLTAIAAMLLPDYAVPRSHTYQIAISEEDESETASPADSSGGLPTPERSVSSVSSSSLSIPRNCSFGDTPCNSYASPSRLSGSSDSGNLMLFSPSPTGISLDMGTPQNTPCSSLLSSGIFLPSQFQQAGQAMSISALSAALAVVDGASECE